MDTIVIFTWTLNGSALLNDPPHIRIREDNRPVRSASLLTDDSTSVLTVDNFRDTDNGVYQCTATNGVASTGSGTAVTLSAVPSSMNGTLRLINQPSANEPLTPGFSFPLLNDNRTGIALGDSTPLGNPGPDPLLTCTAGHHGDGLMNYTPPSVVWVRNGQVVDDTDPRITLNTITMANGQMTSSLTVTDFTLGDAGVYQCVFTDDSDGGNTELITSTPYRLDTGSTISIERVSPEVIVLRPTKKLVIEVRVSGEYSRLNWGKDTSSFIPRLMRPQEFPNFYEIFVRDNTTEDEFGIYSVTPQFKSGTEQTYTIIPTGGVAFAVISPGDANTTALSDSVFVIPEGGNGTISCRSVGAPVPSITWKLNNQTIVFEQTDTVTPYAATLTGYAGSRFVDLTPGNIVSTLHIVSARYPDHDGVYTCIGTNAGDLAIASSSASVTVQVHDLPQIISPLENFIYIFNENTPFTFNCSASGIPAPTISWFRIIANTSTMLTNDTSSLIPPSQVDETYQLPDGRGTTFLVTSMLTIPATQNEDSGQYACQAVNDVGNETREFELIVQVAPEIMRTPGDVEIVEGMSAEFICNATGRPRPTITWYRTVNDGNIQQPVNLSDPRVTVTVSKSGDRELTSTLTLSDTLPSDAADYVCVAENAVVGGRDMGTGTLTVNVLPTVTSVYPTAGRMNYTVDETEPVTFECTATGIPAPDIEFNFSTIANRVQIAALSTSVEVVRRSDGETILEITRTATIHSTMDADSGVYVCTATNDASEVVMDSAQFELIVQVAPTLKFAQEPVNLTVIRGSNAVFECQASGVPRPTISWEYSDPVSMSTTTITNDGTNYTVTELTDSGNDRLLMSTLTVLATDTADFGIYRCVATNVVAMNSVSAMLTVHVPAIITTPEPGIRLIKSTSVTFTCSATGIPTPLIQWYRGDLLLNGTGPGINSRVDLTSNVNLSSLGRVGERVSMLTISSTMGDDSGNYTCVATNELFNYTDTVESRIENITNLFVQVSPEVVPLVGNQITNESESVTLRFRITNAAPPVMVSNIRWFYSADFDTSNPCNTDPGLFKEITNLANRTSSSTLTYSSDHLSLTIGNIVQARAEGEETDQGRYILQATNEAGADCEVIVVIVFGQPVVINPPIHQFAINNESSATFLCNTLADPMHTISWTFTDSNGVNTEIDVSSSKYFINTDRNTTRFGELTVMNVDYEDRGVYACTVTNSIGSVEASANLTVHVTPSFRDISDQTEVNVSTPAVLACLATGFPVPTISWRKNGEEVNIYSDVLLNSRIDIIEFTPDSMVANDTDFQSHGYMGSSSIVGLLMMHADVTVDQVLQLGELGVVSLLSFENTVRDDTANYTCVATNSLPETTTLTSMSNDISLVILVPCPLHALSNGRVAYSMTGDPLPLGTVVTYTCDTGYELTGNEMRTCLKAFGWSGSLPNCTVVNCSPLTNPPNGQVDTSSGTTFNQVAMYTCDSGYDLLGSVTRICGVNGDWTEETPQCISTMVTPSGSPMAGQSFSLTCSVTGVGSPAAIISYQWFKEQSLVTSSSVLSYKILYLSDAGQYMCVVSIKYDRFSLTIGRSYDFRFQYLSIQLRLGGLSNCRLFIQSETVTKTAEITENLAMVVDQSCRCGYNSSVIFNSFIRCFDNSPQHVTYRAVLTGTPSVSAVELSSLLNQWIRDTGKIVIQSARFSLSDTCPVVIADIEGPECPRNITIRPANDPTEPISNRDIGAVVGGVVGGVLAPIIVAILVVVVLVVFRHRRSESKDITSSIEQDTMHSNIALYGLHSTDEPRVYDTIEGQDDTYENVEKPHPPAGDYELTTCAAYVPTTFATENM